MKQEEYVVAVDYKKLNIKNWYDHNIVDQWCQDNIKLGTFAVSKIDQNDDRFIVHYSFKNKEDSVLFALNWA